MSAEVSYYDLSRAFFNFCFENTDKVNPNHVAVYFFCLEHNNRLGQKDVFRLPMEMTMEAVGIKNYKTWSKTFNDLISWNFIKLVQKSTNQYSANVIGIVKNTKATYKARSKALDKATLKHSQKQHQKQVHGIVGIDKPLTTNQEPLTTNHVIPPQIEWVKNYCEERKNLVDPEKFFDFYASKNWMVGKNKMKDWQACVRTWEKNDKKFNNNGTAQNQFTGNNGNSKLSAYERNKNQVSTLAARSEEFLQRLGSGVDLGGNQSE